jgi:hypothetical protein
LIVVSIVWRFDLSGKCGQKRGKYHFLPDAPGRSLRGLSLKPTYLAEHEARVALSPFCGKNKNTHKNMIKTRKKPT